MFLELEFEELENAFDLELEQVTEISDGGYDRGYGDAMEETDAEATIQEDLLSQVADALENKVSGYERGKKEGFAEALDKRTDLVVTANGEYTPSEDSTGFKSVSVNVASKLGKFIDNTLTEITAEDLEGATKIAQNKFDLNSKVTSVEIPSSVEVIDSYAFYLNKTLKSVIIGEGVTRIWTSAFQDTSSLKSVILKPKTPPTIQSSTFKNVPTDCVFTVKSGSGDAYRNATNWSAKADQIVEGDV